MSRAGKEPSYIGLHDAASVAAGRLQVAHYLLEHQDSIPKSAWTNVVIEEQVTQALTVLRSALKGTK